MSLECRQEGNLGRLLFFPLKDFTYLFIKEKRECACKCMSGGGRSIGEGRDKQTPPLSAEPDVGLNAGLDLRTLRA